MQRSQSSESESSDSSPRLSANEENENEENPQEIEEAENKENDEEKIQIEEPRLESDNEEQQQRMRKLPIKKSRDRIGRKKGLRSNTSITDKPQNVGEILQKYRSKSRRRTKPKRKSGSREKVQTRKRKQKKQKSRVSSESDDDDEVQSEDSQSSSSEHPQSEEEGSENSLPLNMLSDQASPYVHPDRQTTVDFANISATSQQVNELHKQLEKLKLKVNQRIPRFQGLTEEEAQSLVTDNSKFYKKKKKRREVVAIEDKEAEKQLRKYPYKLREEEDEIRWFDRFDYNCDEWGISDKLRYRYCITLLFSSRLIAKFRAARENEEIENYKQLKEWMFRARNGRAKIKLAKKRVMKWSPRRKDTSLEQFNDFLNMATTYKRELQFGLEWGLKRCEINRIEEGVLFDTFMDRASASKKLWEIFNEKVTGKRTIRKAGLLAKHMAFLERTRPTENHKHKHQHNRSSKKTHKKYSKKKLQQRVFAINEQWCWKHETDTHSYNECNDNPKNKRNRKFGKGRSGYRGYKGDFKGKGRKDKNRKMNKGSWRNNKPKEPHQPGKNCEDYGHTTDTCWNLHPEQRPKGKNRGKIFALQRELNNAVEEFMNTETGNEKSETEETGKHESDAQNTSTTGSEKENESQGEYDDEDDEIESEDSHNGNSDSETESLSSTQSDIFNYRSPRRE